MPDNNDFKFTLSVSQQSFTSKPPREDSAWGQITFKPQEFTVNTILQAALEGKVFCPSFKSKHPDNSFHIKQKKRENFISTSTIFFDFDNMDVDMETFIENKVDFKPSFAYTTFDNGVLGYRYRLAYVFNRPIVGVDNFNAMYHAIVSANNFKFETDKSGGLDRNTYDMCEQCYLGTNKEASIYYTPYSIFIYTRYDFEPYLKESAQSYQEHVSITTSTEAPPINGDILNDIRNLRFEDFFSKYAPRFYNNYKKSLQTQLILDETKWFYTYPKDYYAVKPHCIKGKVQKWQVGSDRKRKLYVSAKIMLHNLPSLSIDNLLFNLMCEREWYYDNSDNKLSIKVLIDIAKNAFTHDLTLKPTKHHSFTVNKTYWIEQGITANSAKGYVHAYLHSLEVKPYINPHMSIDYNVKLLKNNGISISPSTLRRMVTRGFIEIDNIKSRNNTTYLPERNNDVTNPVTNEILKLITYNSKITQKELAETLQVDIRTIKRYFDEMKGVLIERVGNNRTGYWKVL